MIGPVRQLLGGCSSPTRTASLIRRCVLIASASASAHAVGGAAGERGGGAAACTDASSSDGANAAADVGADVGAGCGGGGGAGVRGMREPVLREDVRCAAATAPPPPPRPATAADPNADDDDGADADTDDDEEENDVGCGWGWGGGGSEAAVPPRLELVEGGSPQTARERITCMPPITRGHARTHTHAPRLAGTAAACWQAGIYLSAAAAAGRSPPARRPR
jgi:hypothetical protein